MIAAWRRDKKFLDDDGRPAPLPMSGPDVPFAELVKRFSGDVPVRATLDELIHVGAVKRLEDGRICLPTAMPTNSTFWEPMWPCLSPP